MEKTFPGGPNGFEWDVMAFAEMMDLNSEKNQ
jgi:hypothetical protein